MAAIVNLYPEYETTSHLDTLRHTEYGYLDEQDHVYLDYTGSGLAARAQHRAHAQRQAEFVLGNPHSVSPTSEIATELVEKTRSRILQHFNASPDEYAVVFTPNATGAARLIGEAYRFSEISSSKSGRKEGIMPKPRLILTADNHNSINGLREYARGQGVSTTYVQSSMPDLHINEQVLLDALGPKMEEATATKFKKAVKSSLKPNIIGWKKARSMKSFFSKMFCGLLNNGGNVTEADTHEKGGRGDVHNTQFTHVPHQSRHDHSHDRGLFAYPAQSNFSGVRHPLRWISEAQERGYDVLLDAAAYLPTSTLDLSEYHPDFVLVSWYKLFGYPTGVGCLIARREALNRLHRPWFSGGTIRAVSVGLDWHAPAHRIESKFEDGTVNFQAIPDVYTGLEWLMLSDKEGGVGGMKVIGTRVSCLTGWFIDSLIVMRHSNGQPLIRLYGPNYCLADGSNRGGTVTFNILDPMGQIIDERIVANEAAAARISLRTGCFCNPGAGEEALGFSHADLRVLKTLATDSIPTSKVHGHNRTDASLSDLTPSLDIKLALKEATHKNDGQSNRKDNLKVDHNVDLVERSTGQELSSASLSSKLSTTSIDKDSKKHINKSPSPSLKSSMKTTNGYPSKNWPVTGAVRVSFGVASNTTDVEKFLSFAREKFLDHFYDSSGLGPRMDC